MLGAMLFTTTGAALGAPFEVATGFRRTMIAILGVMLGAAFTPAIVAQIPQWWPSVILLATFMGLCTSGAYALFRYVGGFDHVTAFFSSPPGGLSEMALLGEEYGGDVRAISMVHATRVLIVVSVIPFYFRFVEGLSVPTLPPGGVSIVDMPIDEGALLILSAIIGYALTRPFKVPAAALLGPMFVSAAFHLGGVSAAAPPVELIAAAQVVVGAAVGCRFIGLTWSFVRRVLGLAALSGAMMVFAAAVATSIFANAIGAGGDETLLSLAPGGLAEMALIALSLGISTAFISTMHILRIAMVVLAIPLAFRAIDKKR
jgi:hypothetical protein